MPYEKIGKNEPVCIADEVPFDIPDSWEWVRFCNIVNYRMGKTPPRKESVYWENSIHNWVSIADMITDGHIKMTKEKVNNYAADSIFKGKKSPAGTLLMSFKLTVGKVSILDVDSFHNEAIISIYPFVDDDKIMTLYLFYVLPLLSQLGESKAAIKGNTLNSKSLDNLWIPLPPLNEQIRICKLIKKLIPWICEYTNIEQKKEDLNKSFPNLLKKSILQEAVQGKLVPQDENDEPASVLLERIRAEKQKLVAEGKIKKDKHESVIFRRDNSHYEKLDGIERCIDDEIPFDIPNNWCWVRLGEIYQHNTGKALNSSNKDGTPLTYITTSNLYWNKFELGNLKKMLFTENEVEKCTVKNGDLLVCEGGDIGRTAIWTYEFPMRIQNHIHRLRPYINIHVKFYYFVLYLYKKSGFLAGKGIGIQGLSSKALHNILVPLPPLSEQHRIVEKIEQLLNVTNKL